MSYSRWGSRGSGYWYTYWCVSDSEERNKQLFDICTVARFTYKQLVDDIDKCLEDVRGLIVKRKEKQETDQKLLDELKVYMLEFMDDVKNDKDLIVSPSDKYKEGEISLDDAFLGEV